MSKVGPGLGDTAAGMSWTPASSRAKLAAKETAKMEELTEKEMEAVTTVFRSFETGLREASIDTKVGQLQLWFSVIFTLTIVVNDISFSQYLAPTKF